MDPDNHVIRLCVAGMAAEEAVRHDEARILFEQAWRQSTDDVEACIAAHYVARQQDNLEKTLWWNQLALARADSSRDARVQPFYSSLHLNVGKAFEDLGQIATARHHYERANAYLGEIGDGGYRVLVAFGVRRALERTKGAMSHLVQGQPIAARSARVS